MASRASFVIATFAVMLCMQTAACTKTGRRAESPPNASFEFGVVVFQPGHPVVGEKLENAFNSAAFDQLHWLNNNVEILKARPRFRVEIVGFADPLECSGQECYELSVRRARLVYGWLVDHDAPKQCLVSFKGRGAEDPLYDSGGEEVRYLNRRVEVTILEIARE